MGAGLGSMELELTDDPINCDVDIKLDEPSHVVDDSLAHL